MKYIIIVLSLILSISCKSDNTNLPKPNPDNDDSNIIHYPGARWTTITKPEDVGFSSSKLQDVSTQFDQAGSAALMVIVNGQILYQRGNIDFKYNSHSIRKSILSAMFGNYVADKTIDLDSDLSELGIDDNETLSSTEKQATIRDLLKARSGIYHPAHYESESMTNRKPDRFEYLPGTYWYYNNWDFNVLGTIFNQQTGKDLFEEFEEKFALPMQMSFVKTDGSYSKNTGINSRHSAYPIRISASDLARFGLLMLNRGKWKDEQIIPSSWVDESTKYYSDASASNISGYGYMWWVYKQGTTYGLLPNLTVPDGSYMASGVGGQIVLIIPKYNMVIVHRVDTGANKSVSNSTIGRMAQAILNARL